MIARETGTSLSSVFLNRRQSVVATTHSTVVRFRQGEVGTEEGLVQSKCSSSFPGKARILSGAHLAQEQLLAGLSLAGVSRICAAPSPPHPSLCLTEDSPGILGFLAGFLPAACTDILEPWCPLVTKSILGRYSLSLGHICPNKCCLYCLPHIKFPRYQHPHFLELTLRQVKSFAQGERTNKR